MRVGAVLYRGKEEYGIGEGYMGHQLIMFFILTSVVNTQLFTVMFFRMCVYFKCCLENC